MITREEYVGKLMKVGFTKQRAEADYEGYLFRIKNNVLIGMCPGHTPKELKGQGIVEGWITLYQRDKNGKVEFVDV